MPIKAAIEEFAQRLHKMIEGHAMERAKAAVLEAFGLHAPKKRGRPPKLLAAFPSSTKGSPTKASPTKASLTKASLTKASLTKGSLAKGPTGSKKARKKLPPQFCPVPGCKNKAAPVFGMVCAEHKGVAKSKIKKYREERKAKKDGKTVAAKTVAKTGSKKVTAKKGTAKKATAKKASAKKAPVKKTGVKKAPLEVRAKAVARKASPRPVKTDSAVQPAPVAAPPAAPVTPAA